MYYKTSLLMGVAKDGPEIQPSNSAEERNQSATQRFHSPARGAPSIARTFHARGIGCPTARPCLYTT